MLQPDTEANQSHTSRKGKAFPLSFHRKLMMDKKTEARIAESIGPVSRQKNGLTEQENKVLYLISCGNSRENIADELSMSPENLTPFIFNIYKKIGAKRVD